MLVNYYGNTSSAVRIGTEHTKFFPVPTGVKQGCPLSCVLFSVFISAIVDRLRNSGLGVWLQGVQICQLWYADDLALVARSAQELQQLLDILAVEASKLRLTVNTDKTKVVVFGARKTSKWQWSIGAIKLETVSSFKYLGVDLAANGKWQGMKQRTLLKAAKKAALAFGVGACGGGLDPDVAQVAWWQLIRPQLEYAAGVWSDDCEWPEAERLQSRVGRRILHCSDSTSSVAVRGELGWWRMKARRDMLCLLYWQRVVCMREDRLTKHVYRATRSMVIAGGDVGHDAGGELWCVRVRRLMCELGLLQYWESEEVPSAAVWCKMVRQKIQEREEGVWKKQAVTQPKLRTYRELKSSLCMEKYLLARVDGRRAITRLRCGTNELSIESGRWRGLTIADRVCPMCLGAVEDERHFLLKCPAYARERELMFEEVKQVSRGVVNIVAAADDACRMRLLIGCGCDDENYAAVYNVVGRFVADSMAYRSSFLSVKL